MIDKLKHWGMGMTDIIIILSLIAIAVIAVYGFFGEAIQTQSIYRKQVNQEAKIITVNRASVAEPSLEQP